MTSLRMTKLVIRTPDRGKCNLTESDKMGRMGKYAEATEAGYPGRGATKE